MSTRVQAKRPEAAASEQCAEKLRVLADSTRLAIMRALLAGPQRVGELNEELQLEQSLLSHHLRVLREAGLVAVHRDGQRRMYMLRPEGIEDLESFLRGLWPSGLDRLSQVAEEGGG